MIKTRLTISVNDEQYNHGTFIVGAPGPGKSPTIAFFACIVNLKLVKMFASQECLVDDCLVANYSRIDIFLNKNANPEDMMSVLLKDFSYLNFVDVSNDVEFVINNESLN